MLLVVLPPLLLVAFMDVFEQCLPPALAISANNNIILNWMKPNWFITVHFAEVINPTQQAGI